MPTMLEFVMNLKLLVMLALLHQTNGYKTENLTYNSPILSKNNAVPGRDHVMWKGMNSGGAIRGAYTNFIRSWMQRAAVEMFITSDISQNCSQSLSEYFEGLRSMKTWAIQMLDSTGKLPVGMLGGNPMAFGDYDTCLEVKSPSQRFQGQYCYVEVSLPLPERGAMTPVDMPALEVEGLFKSGSILERAAKLSNILYLGQLRLTACLPSTCSKEEIRSLLSNSISNSKLETTVEVPHCETNEDQKFEALEILIIIIFSLLICLVIMGTLQDIILRNNSNYDIETAVKSATTKALLCFSVYSNFLRLIKEDRNPDTLHVIHGLRVMSMIWIMWSHCHLLCSYKAFDGELFGLEVRKEFIFQLVPCGFLAVETFFFMSSVLVAYVTLRMRGRINVPLIFLKRYLRLTPTMMLVVAFFAMVRRLGSGPIWKETVSDTISKNCLERGWINMFYINNIHYSDKTCLGWTWYLSTDTQMFLVSLYICVVLKKKPRKGLFFAGLILIVGVLLGCMSHVYYKLPPTYLLTYPNFDDWYYYANRGYTQVYFHLPVCAVGLTVGYILAKKRCHIPKHVNALGWFFSATIFLILMGLTYKWNQGMHAIPTVFVSAMYGGLHRFAWALCLAFITISCTWGQGGVVNSFLCWEGFVPFARLTYMVYLVHYGFLYIYTGIVRQSMTFNHRSMYFIFFHNVFLSYFAALVLGLIFESPFTAMEKAFSDGKLRKQIMPVSVSTENCQSEASGQKTAFQ